MWVETGINKQLSKKSCHTKRKAGWLGHCQTAGGPGKPPACTDVLRTHLDQLENSRRYQQFAFIVWIRLAGWFILKKRMQALQWRSSLQAV